MKESTEETKTVVETGIRINKPFTLQELQEYWNAFANKFKAENKTSEYIIMANRDLILEEDYTIKLALDNPVQIDQLSDFKADLLSYLRKSLNNSLIIIETLVVERQTEKKIYTDNDKLAFILNKYPVVADLKKRLGLDTDY